MHTARRICQVTGLGVSLLTCSRTDSRGYLCERTDPHTEGHWISQHTIDHALAGNGYTCESFGW